MAGQPQKLSKGQEDDVVRILHASLIKWITIGFTLLTAITGVGLWQIMINVKKNMEQLVARQFEEPRIRKVVQDVAAERSSVLMNEQILPEVKNF